MDINGLDLNLLKVFVAVDEFRHITRAAEALNLTQPAVSHALNRLRESLNDPLFVKTSSQMVPTPVGKKLSRPIKEILEKIQTEVLQEKRFDPFQMERTFKIRTTDLVEQLLIGGILDTFQSSAPKAKLMFRSLAFNLPVEELESGSCDLAIAGFFGELPDGFYRQALFSDGFRCCIRSSHPKIRRSWTLADYCAAEHILIAPGGEFGSKIDQLLSKQKIKRNVVAGTSGFFSSVWGILESDCVLTGPASMIKKLEEFFPVTSFDVPIAIPPIKVVQVWHARNNNDQEHRWLRERVHQVFASKKAR